MRFKDLPVNTVFEFDHSRLTVGCLQMTHGPWVKLEGRQYVSPNGGYIHKVGSINTTVVRDTHCGGRYGGR